MGGGPASLGCVKGYQRPEAPPPRDAPPPKPDEAPDARLRPWMGSTQIVAGVMVDWQGRIWFITAANGTTVAKVGLIDPTTWSDAAPSAKWWTPCGRLRWASDERVGDPA